MKKLVLVSVLSTMMVAPVPALADWKEHAKDAAKGVAVGVLYGIFSKPEQSPPVATQPTSTTRTTSTQEVAYTPMKVYNVECKVVGVSDGDTFTCLDDSNTQIKVRMSQIDAPESGQDYGKVAKQALSDHIHGQRVGLVVTGTDRYNRTLAEVYRLSDDQNINKMMVRDGMAWAYQEYLTDYEYTDIESVARSSSVGLWSQPNPVYPSVWRSTKATNTVTTTTKSTTTSSPRLNQVLNKSQNGKCGTKKTCGQMSSCAEAKYYLNTCGLSKLDKDGDGTPCESLCR